MKKLLSIVLIVMMILTTGLVMAGCGEGSGTDTNPGATGTEGQNDYDQGSENGTGEDYEIPDSVSAIVKVAALNGPTGMSCVRLMDMTEKYQVTTYQAPTDVVPKLISGDVDAAFLPSNMAAVLYNKTSGAVVAVSPTVMGVLHILGNSVDGVKTLKDLKGKTIVSSGQGGTPEYALQKIIENAGLTVGTDDSCDVKVEWLASHADVNTRLLTREGTIAMMPEPFVSTAMAKGGEAVSELFDMNREWREATGADFPMGVLVVTREFFDNRVDDLKLLLWDLKESTEEVNTATEEICDLLVERGFLGDPAIAAKAIPNCNLTLYTGEAAEEGMRILKTFNETIYVLNPEAVGGALPEDDMYGTVK